ncbi:C-type lectin domain family 14 member A [Melopsittacus undulatus]|uniref:C-type lectin domain family 14 member A n=1 Tax=Melopsittacus undulatus TaxID=13146 RepID=UPI00146E46D5|nr:C-type lectin domain family 14 member A [Melopsittacus undulatus]
MPRSTPAPDMFPPAGPGEGRGSGNCAGAGRHWQPGPARAGAELRHSCRGCQVWCCLAALCSARMRRPGPWCLLLAAACALARPSQSPRAAVRCQATGTCFSAHLVNASYTDARAACGGRRGSLAWLSNELELRLLLGLLADAAAGSAPSLFWVGLKRGASACTDAGQPLRGFSWEGTGGEAAPQEVPAALGRWVKEPVRSCLAVRCAGLHLAAAAPDGGPSWGWKERFCQRESQGYVCKYLYEGACPDLSPTDALGLDYSLPFGESSVGPGFSPPGTVLTVVCSGGEVRLICRPQRGGFAWQGADGPLCPCPIHHRRPATGQCSQTAGCRDAAGGFSCACTTGGLEGTLCAATGGAPTTAGGPAEPPGAGADERRPHAATPGGSAGPPAAPTAASDGEKTDAALPSSSSNYVFILVTVAVVVLIVLIMTLLGVFKLCFNKKSEGRGDKEPPETGSKAAAGSGEPSEAAVGE